MNPYCHQKTVITTVFLRPNPDGRSVTEETRQVVINNLYSDEFHEAFCLLEGELDRLNDAQDTALVKRLDFGSPGD